MINNRQGQAGRRRGRGGSNGQRPQGGGGQGRGDSGNRIDSRARGNAAQMYEKYKNLARDAQQQGDRVNIEYYLQFADHYFRVLAETRSRFEENQPRRPQQSGDFEDGFDGDGDDDYGNEGEPVRAGEQSRDQGREQSRDQGREQNRDQSRDQNARDDDRRPARGYEGNNGNTNNGYAGNGNGNNGGGGNGERRPRYDRDAGDQQRAAQPRQEQPRQEQPRQEQPRQEQPRQEQPRQEQAPRPDVSTDPHPESVEAAPAPRRRGRPRRDAAVEAEAPVAFEADRLPPSLGISAVVPDEGASDGDAPKPRRRRVRPTEASPAE